MSNIEEVYKLESLAERLVPAKFRSDAPQYYDLIKAFLVNLQGLQDIINESMTPIINLDKITENDIIEIYVDTYLKTLNLEDVETLDVMKDLVKESKELVSKKGTLVLYNILVRLLGFLFPSLNTQFVQLTEALELAETDEQRAEIQEQLDELAKLSLDAGWIEVSEYEDESNSELVQPFIYLVRSNFSRVIFEKYLKPFAHPAGWHVDFVQVIRIFATENLTSYLRFNMTITKKLPTPKAGDGYLSGNTDQRYTDSYDVIELGDESELSYFNDIVVRQENLFVKDAKVYYKSGGIHVAPPWYELDIDAMIDNGSFLTLVAGYEGLFAGADNLVAGNTNKAFPLKVVPFKYIDINYYTGDNAIYKTDTTVNQPIYDGIKQNILPDGTTLGSSYLKDNQYNSVFDLVANSNYTVNVGTDRVCAGGGAVAGHNNAFYSEEIVDDINR